MCTLKFKVLGFVRDKLRNKNSSRFTGSVKENLGITVALAKK